MKKVAALGLSILVCLGVMSVPVLGAGILPGHAGAYSSGNTPFSGGAGLNGQVEWAVFAPGAFPFDTGGAWTPAVGEMSYVYQLYSTGTDEISKYQVPLFNPSGNEGAFEATGITGILPDSVTLGVPGSVEWFFIPKLGQNENSSALAFSSPTIPIDTYSIVVNGGSYTLAIPIPTPGTEPIPEPGTLVLLLGGFAFAALTRMTRRR